MGTSLQASLDVREQLADCERSITLIRDAPLRDQLICMALPNRSDQKRCPQPAVQRLENPSRFSAFWLIKKEVVCDQMSEERTVFSAMHAAYHYCQLPTAHFRLFTSAGPTPDSVPGEVACLLPGRALHPLEALGLAWRTDTALKIQSAS